MNRCLLLTDGLANIGLTEPVALAAFAKDLRASSGVVKLGRRPR